MIVRLSELALPFDRDAYDDWKNGDKSVIPSFLRIPKAVENQQQYHFGEMFALRYFHENEGWLGYDGYALGTHLPNSEHRREGRRKVEDVVPPDKLERFRQLRNTEHDKRHGAGEPDLFLYSPDEEHYKLAEVKMPGDRLSPAQYRCIAQILASLECEVEIVHLHERGTQRRPKVYCFDLDSFSGWSE